MALQASKTCEIWIPLNPSVFSSGSFEDPGQYFPSLFSLFEFWQSFSQGFLLSFPCCWMPFTIGCFPFYSAILGFSGYYWFPQFAPLGTRINVVPATLVASPFLIPHYFLLLRFLPKKNPLADFPVLGVLGGWLFVLSFSKASKFHFSDPPFGCFSFCHFSQVSWFFSARLKDLKPPSFLVLPRFPEVPTPHSWVVDSQVFWSFFCIIGWLMGHFSPCSLCF